MTTVADDWRTQSACRNLPTRLFFPDRGHHADPARTVCQRCPVQAQCAADGAREPHGIWADTSVAQRGNSLHNRGEPHRVLEVFACTVCDARVWADRHASATGFRCDACRFDDEDVA